MMRVVVMGVSGAGKTTVGMALAERLGVAFLDADDLHPVANVEKMTAGTPLTDLDRAPWLVLVGRAVADAPAPGVVMACSALQREYRDAIREHAPDAFFVHLDADAATLERHLEHRTGHFMPPSLLTSQLAALEPLAPDEAGVVIDVGAPLEAVIDGAAAAVMAH
jgi:carbohydrate kinase (thermoresistant glucokinase family)